MWHMYIAVLAFGLLGSAYPRLLGALMSRPPLLRENARLY